MTMTSNDPKKLRGRIADLMAAWAPPHAKFMIANGYRLSDGDGITWVHDMYTSARFSEDEAISIWRNKGVWA